MTITQISQKESGGFLQQWDSAMETAKTSDGERRVP